MSAICTICKKGPVFGNNVSHAHNKTKRRWNPNLQNVRALHDGKVRKIKVCSRCIRSGAVVRTLS